MEPKPGDKIKIITKEGEKTGVLMPSEDKNAIFIKLESGYNIGINRNTIKKIEILKKYKEKKIIKEKSFISGKGKPTITILHTGGTIASKVDYKTGGVISRFDPDELISLFPELKKIANIKSKLIAQMFSEDIRFGHYKLMVDSIKEEIKSGVDGIILAHGTDTMTYSSAALAFALENLPIPVILVGAQRSSDRGSSDAALNLICAAEFIAKTDFAGVAICMHENIEDKNCLILPACKTKKLHSSRRDAFKPVNDGAIARVIFNTKKIEFIKKDYLKKDKTRKLVIKDKFEEKVSILRVHPTIFNDEIDFYKEKKYKGLIIEGTGLGQAPVGAPNKIAEPNLKNLKAISDLINSGTIVVMTSQTIFGTVNMNVYSNGRDLLSAGVIPGQDMLTETAFIKLAWLLGNYSDKEEIKKLMTINLRGEINPRIMPSQFLD